MPINDAGRLTPPSCRETQPQAALRREAAFLAATFFFDAAFLAAAFFAGAFLAVAGLTAFFTGLFNLASFFSAVRLTSVAAFFTDFLTAAISWSALFWRLASRRAERGFR